MCVTMSLLEQSVCVTMSLLQFFLAIYIFFFMRTGNIIKCVSPLCVRVDLCLVILWHVPCFQAELSLGSILTQYLFDSRLN